MNKQELIADNLKRHESKVKATSVIPDDDSINCLLCADDNCVFLKTIKTWHDCCDMLHNFAKHWGKYKVESYYMSCGATELCIKYHFTENDMKLLMYCEEYEAAVESLGKGKCRIVEYVREPSSYSDYRVVCDNV